MMSQQIEKKYTLNYFDPNHNSNKVWIGLAHSDGTFEARFGRVRDGANLAVNRKKLSSADAALRYLETKRNEKLRKGYRDTATFSDGESATISAPVDLKAVAVSEIEGASDDATTRELVEYLAKVNIHNICSVTSLKYNTSNATFSTPLGVLTPDAVKTARALLDQINSINQSSFSYNRSNVVRDYFQLVPKDFGTRIPSNLLTSAEQIEAEAAILDALEAAFPTAQTTSTGRTFECRLEKVPGSTAEGRAEFARINQLYRSTLNVHHRGVSNLKLTRLYRVEMSQMKTNFEAMSQKIGNVREDLWHGTKSSNLLSILKNGLIIPPPSAAHCTGRMFGNGIYSSLQSTKALNYATDFWNGSGGSSQRTFMFLCAAALGTMHKPTGSGRQFPKAGSHSTWVDANSAGVLNHEAIVYETAQMNLKYLCEFA